MGWDKKWKQEELEYLRNHYGKDKVADIAEYLGRSKQGVMKKASELKIPSKRFLTVDEREWFIDHAYLSNPTLARLLGRNTEAIKSMRHLYCDTVILSNERRLTCAEVGRLVGKDKSTIAKCWCKTLKHRMVGKYKMVSISELHKWMQANPKRWDATECDYYYFYRYDWFNKKLTEDRNKKIQERWYANEKTKTLLKGRTVATA